MLNRKSAGYGITGNIRTPVFKAYYIILPIFLLLTAFAKGQTVPSRLQTGIVDSCAVGNADVDTVRPFYMNVRSNLLLDLFALPNVGAEVYVGKDFSAGLNWTYAWWSNDSRHFYWRAYGGEIFGRWWWSKTAERKPLTGHHIGLYGQAFIYDFEWGGQGQMGGKPGGSFFDKTQLGIGVEYGFSLPVARNINIDFSIGVGYIGGTYINYEPIDNHYVYRSTHRRNYFGPTKIEMSFVWLIGHGNFNSMKAKGGDR